jgi:hypothetical protein
MCADEYQQHASGMRREAHGNRPRPDLLVFQCLNYQEQPLVRLAAHMTKGAIKYAPRNFEQAYTDEEAERAQASASRHFVQWLAGETDEDHASAVVFNIWEYEMIRRKMERRDPE